ncbi:MAG: alpha/beta fold hydrolase [Actinomycetales bacterium]|nr:alpha/beta fold hydrolase [Actinomycetales bacterium]
MGLPARHGSLPRSGPRAAAEHYGEPVQALSSRHVPTGAGFDLVVSVTQDDDATARVERSGALPVLLLHGLSQQRQFWNPVIRRLRSRPVASLDQRGHGESDSALDADYSIAACADDALRTLDELGWARAVVVGHSWGCSVALGSAAAAPQRIAAVGLVDGGLWSPASLGTREEARERLTPPALGMPEAELWAAIRSGDLGESWSPEVEAALRPTFVVDDEGRIRTRLGLDRHMKVLDGLLDYDARADLTAVRESGVPVWAAVCEGVDRSWQESRAVAVAEAARLGNVLVHRWAGAVHDVPLQWPALVAGFIDALVESEEGGTG